MTQEIFSESENNSKNDYQTKTLAELIEERGVKAIKDIQEKMGGWPAVKGDSWDETSWTWQKSAIGSRRNGYSTDYIVDFSVGTDLKNSSTYIVDVRLAREISSSLI